MPNKSPLLSDIPRCRRAMRLLRKKIYKFMLRNDSAMARADEEEERELDRRVQASLRNIAEVDATRAGEMAGGQEEFAEACLREWKARQRRSGLVKEEGESALPATEGEQSSGRWLGGIDSLVGWRD